LALARVREAMMTITIAQRTMHPSKRLVRTVIKAYLQEWG
jgi:hypothetical protein